MFASPVPRIKKEVVISKLRMCGAVSPESAMELEEAGIFAGMGLKIELLVLSGILGKTNDGRFYAK